MATFTLRSVVEPETDEAKIERNVSNKVKKKLEEAEEFTPKVNERGMQRQLDQLDLSFGDFDIPDLSMPSFGGIRDKMSRAAPSVGGAGGGGLLGAAAGEGMAAAGGRAGSKAAGALGGLGKIVSGGALTVALGGAVGFGILKQLEKASPALQQTFGLLGQVWNKFWRPFGTELAKGLIGPMKNLNKFANSFLELYAEEGLVGALKELPEMLGQIDFGEVAAGFGQFTDDIVNGIQEVMADWAGDAAEAVFGKGVGNAVEGGVRGMSEGIEFSMDKLGGFGALAAPGLGGLGALLGATGTDTKEFFDEMREFDMEGAIGEIDFSFIEDDWPGWPDLSGMWPGWPDIDTSWPGWPDIGAEWPGWPRLRIPADFWPHLSERSLLSNIFGDIRITKQDIFDAFGIPNVGGNGGGGHGGGEDNGINYEDSDDYIEDPYGGYRPIGGDGEWVGLQSGGIVTRPTRAMVGERGPEAVLPIDQLNDFIEEPDPQEINVQASNNREMLRKLDQLISSFEDGLDRLAESMDSMIVENTVNLDSRTLSEQTERANKRYINSREVTR